MLAIGAEAGAQTLDFAREFPIEEWTVQNAASSGLPYYVVCMATLGESEQLGLYLMYEDGSKQVFLQEDGPEGVSYQVRIAMGYYRVWS